MTAVLYLYAIVGARPRTALGVGLAGGRLSVIRAGGAYVVVERASSPPPTASALRGHDRIVRRIARLVTSVLPFRFGSVASDEDALDRLLEPAKPSIAQALELVRGCVQFTLRAYGEPTATPPARGGVGPGARWLDEKLRARLAPELAPMAEATASWVRSSRVERHDRPPLLATAYHLVARRDVAAYRRALTRSSRALAPVEIRASGPFPPYAFTELS